MTSPLAGSLAKAIGKAFSSLFLDATLTRGTTVYPCKAIYEKISLYPGANAVLKTEDYTIIVLASTLAVQPVTGDVINLEGRTSVVYSGSDKAAVVADPAFATWTLLCQNYPLSNNVTDSNTALANALGTPFDVYRAPTPILTDPFADWNLVETIPAIFTNARSTTGFSVTKSIGPDDFLWNVLADTSMLQVGDFMVGAATYFIAAMPPLTPVVSVLCNTTVSVTRPSSQVSPGGGAAPAQPSGGTGDYWGTNPATDTPIAAFVPAAIQGTTGRATGTGELPTDAPGPSRWRIFLPQSACPKGTVRDRDIIVDDQGYRHQVSAAVWTEIGYRVDVIRLEN